ncbi:hypothetical protein B0H14DRAFT_3443233 [Mycena olivaceomarginata]|nr:hypothetical protein B0H14DRAFT_3443233 [Mycena olivaceomarginata]
MGIDVLGRCVNTGGINATATWDGKAMGAELRGKGRERVATVATIHGIQRNASPSDANEQEHFTGGSMASQIYSSANIDDKPFHELYLWPSTEAVKFRVGSVMCG